MTDVPGALFLITSAVTALLGYAIGYVTALLNLREQTAQLKDAMTLVATQQTQLVHWVRTNWPNEYAAYRRGISDGYQQGIDHAPHLKDAR